MNRPLFGWRTALRGSVVGTLWLSLLFLAVGCCHRGQPLGVAPGVLIGSQSRELKELSRVIARFEEALAAKNVDGLLACMHPVYLINQHDRLLEGRTGQFLDEFFAGESLMDPNAFASVAWRDIVAVELESVHRVEGGWKLVYLVTGIEGTVRCGWMAQAYLPAPAKDLTWGFSGAWG